MPLAASIVPLLTNFTRWAANNSQVKALALAGSYARGEARPDSDIDLVLLVDDPTAFRAETTWVSEIDWGDVVRASGWQDRDYGVLWSRHVQLSSGLVVEVGFSTLAWAATRPLDAGTAQVVRDGFYILLDPSGVLNELLRAAEAIS